jgi:hypothetical protein
MDAPNSFLSDAERFALTIIYQRALILSPILNADFGYRYPEAENIFKASPKEAIDRIHSLWRRDYLVETPCATVLKCPKCGSYTLILRLQCPYCGSFKLLRGNSIKHYSCGHINFEEEFRRGDELVCPNCNKKLEKLGLDYMRVGIWYRCLDCEKSFGEPKEILYCPKCDKDFDREELVLEPLYSFKMNETIARELLLDIDLKTLEEAFIKEWIVDMPAKVIGKSGIEHICSVGLTRKGLLGKKLFIDIEYATDLVDAYAVMRFFAKIMDIKSGTGLLIGIPKFSEEAKKLAATYEIKIFEGSKFSDLTDEIRDYSDVIIEEEILNVQGIQV